MQNMQYMQYALQTTTKGARMTDRQTYQQLWQLREKNIREQLREVIERYEEVQTELEVTKDRVRKFLSVKSESEGERKEEFKIQREEKD